MIPEEIKPELLKELEKEAKAAAFNNTFKIRDDEATFISGALNPIAHKIYTQGMVSIEDDNKRIEYKKACRREAIVIKALAVPVDQNHDNMTRTMFDLLDMVMVLTNDVNI